MMFRHCVAASLLLLLVYGCSDQSSRETGYRQTDTLVAQAGEPLVIDVSSCILQSSFPDHGAWSPAVDGQVHALGALDTNAAYWIAGLPVLDSVQRQHAHFELRGSLPATRYFSLHLYNEKGEICDHLTDHRIDPVAGSVNPFRDNVAHPGADRSRYRLRIEQLPPDQRPTEHPGDVLYGGYARHGGEAQGMVLMLRQYHPLTRQGGIGGVPLPSILLVIEDQSDASLPRSIEEACAMMPQDERFGPYTDFAAFEALDADAQALLEQLPHDAQQRVVGFNPPDPPEWILGNHLTGMLDQGFPLFPDALVVRDINQQGAAWNFDTRYLAAFLDPARLLKPFAVARIKAPSSATDPEQLGNGAAQLRYFSICIVQPVVLKPNILNPTFDCLRDDQLVRDPDDPESFTLVFGLIDSRPAEVCDVLSGQSSGCKYNWIPYPGPTPYVVYRQLVASPDYSEATQHFGDNPNHDDPFAPAQLAEHMGPYYPRSAYCRLAELRHNRCGLE